jgi:D-alanine-D-alanine ligase
MTSYDVAVFFGGISNENEISVITGTMTCNILKNGGLKVLPVYVTQAGKMYAGEGLADINCFKGDIKLNARFAAVCDGGILLYDAKGKLKGKVEADCALNCCHGGLGEGGGACGLFGLNNIPLASAKLFESSAFMNKYYTKIVLTGLGVNVAPYRYLRDMSGAIAKAVSLGYPIIVKPANLGSSIGIKKVDREEELIPALQAAFAYDDGVLLESFISPRREINCAAYMADDKVILSECEEAITTGCLLSYDDKYSGSGRSVYPADIDGDAADKIKGITEYVYSALDMRGIVRFDFIMSDEQIYLSEINTVPGSLAHYLLSRSFSDFFNVLQGVIRQAQSDKKRAAGKMLINTGIINNFTSNACKIK